MNLRSVRRPTFNSMEHGAWEATRYYRLRANISVPWDFYEQIRDNVYVWTADETAKRLTTIIKAP